jgi:hypothetical protein
MFEVLSYLRTRALPEAVQESLIEERKSLPQTINALKVSISSRKRELRQAVEASFPDIAEALFVLGAKWQGTTAITLPDGFQKPAREAHGRAHNGEIGKMSSEIVQLEARLNSPVDPSNKAESVGHQVMTEAMAKHGFDFTRDWLEPFFRGQ